MGAMLIQALVPVEKLSGAGTYTYREAERTVEVRQVIRVCIDRVRKRYAYEALVAPPADLVDESHFLQQGLLRVSISRALNPAWKPPVFPEGKHSVLLAHNAETRS